MTTPHETRPGAGASRLVGFTCSYTPLPLIHAAGLTPYRLLPVGDWPEQAGGLLHVNMCPHVKRVVDRALAGELPPLAGLIVMNSCDTMRRLSDAWAQVHPADLVAVVDLPAQLSGAARPHLVRELHRLSDLLAEWSGNPVDEAAIHRSIDQYNELAQALTERRDRVATGTYRGGRPALQQLYNAAVTEPVEQTLAELARSDAQPSAAPDPNADGRVPVYLFGNVMPDPAMLELLESTGCRVVGDDLCTGSRQLVSYGPADGADPWTRLARGLADRPPCARTLPAADANSLGQHIVAGARERGARGAIAYVMKFCDSYLARLPAVRVQLKAAGLPLLILDGDGTQRSLGQLQTRIEAFVELLQDAPGPTPEAPTGASTGVSTSEVTP
jgi:benzoyl-CoA reductase/2-hydroxyglutaryl-CoA dehydratase subunit BcrC/BadD/HgdB